MDKNAWEVIQGSHLLSISCDEVTSIDKGAWISIHMYVVQNWQRIPILINFEHVLKEVGVDSLMALVVKALVYKGSFTHNALASKLMSFGVGIHCFPVFVFFTYGSV